jgi:hypothetical protein
VRDRLVIRVREAPEPEALALLNDQFGDIVAAGSIEVSGALPEEGGEADPFPRVVLRFDRKQLGRLRQLIDRLNALSEAESTATDAAPPEIVAEPLSPEAEKAERGGA